jgi:formylglycine-generating enzyme required for sulfatase activity
MLKPDGLLALIDFGTAREVTSTYVAKQAAGKKITGVQSFGYAPPEQINGYAVLQSDFFALGRTFVYLLTGKDPNELYDPYTDECNWRISAAHVSPLLADFIDHLMARLPGERPANTQVILQELGEIEGALYPPPDPPPTNQPVLQRFEFELMTLAKQQSGLFGINVTLTVYRRRSQAKFFTEDLGNGVILEMVAIPSGSFLMGSPNTEAKRHNHESPQRLVSVSPFYMGKFTVTQAQWRAVAALAQVQRFLNPEPSYFKGDNLPVEQISWDDAVEFCARLSKKTGRHYRLPSEAEWEYACRAGTTKPFHFGETITTYLANYDGNYTYDLGLKGVYRQQTTPVGNFQVANAFGLYDMHGNVREWCADHWHENYQGAPSDGRVWQNGTGNRRLVRGGSWFNDPKQCRCAHRYSYDQSVGNHDIGIRVACA